jgi:hypothetical protein
VDRKGLDMVLGCFCDDAIFTIQSHHSAHVERDTGIKKRFSNLFENYSGTDGSAIEHRKEAPRLVFPFGWGLEGRLPCGGVRASAWIIGAKPETRLRQPRTPRRATPRSARYSSHRAWNEPAVPSLLARPVFVYRLSGLSIV